MSYGANLHVAQALTDMAVAYKPSDKGFLRDKFFPRKDVAHITDKLRAISKANALLKHDLKIGNDGRVPEVQYRIDTDITYLCQAYGAEVVISDMDVSNADAALMHEQRQAEHAMFVISNALEYEALQLLRSTAVLTNNKTLSGGTLWDAYGSSTSDPIGDMLNGCTLVRYRTGNNVNRIGFSETTWNAILQHPNVQERVRLNGAAGSLLTTKILADILRIDESAINISAQTYNTAAQGLAGSYKSFIGSDVIIAYVAESAGTYDYGLGHEFAFSGYGSSPVVVVKYRDEKRGGLLGANVIRAGSIVDFKVTQADSAFLIKTCLDTTNAAYGGYVD